MTDSKKQLTRAKKDSDAEAAELDVVSADLASFVVESDEDAEFAIDVAREAKAKATALEKKRKDWVGPLNGVVKDINATFKPVVDGWKSIERHMKSAVVEYRQRAEVQAEKLLDQAGKESGPDRVDLVAQAAESRPTELSGAQVRRIRRVVVKDAQKLMQHLIDTKQLPFLLLNDKAIKAAALVGNDFGGFVEVVEDESIALT